MSMKLKSMMSLGAGIWITVILACASTFAMPVAPGPWRADSSIGDGAIIVGVDGEIDEIHIRNVDTGNPHFGRRDFLFGTGTGYHHIEWSANNFTAGTSEGSYSETRSQTYAFRVLGTVITATHIEATWSAFGSDSYIDAHGEWQYQQYALQGSLSADRIHPDAPGLTLAVSPVGPVATGQKRPAFNWNVSDRAIWYKLVVKRDGRIALNQWIEAPATTFTPSYDLQGGDYTWQVAGWNLHGLGQWASGAFSIPVQRPDVLIQIAPAPGSVLPVGTVTYSFLQDPMASWSQIWIGRNDTTWHSQWVNTSAPAPSGVIEIDIPDHLWGRYRWCVRGWGPDGMGDWSGVDDFVIGQPVAVSGSASQATWNNGPVSAASWYQIWIGKVGPGALALERTLWFSKADTAGVGGGHRSVSLSPLLSTGSYRWFIRAWDLSNGLSPWSTPGDISVP